MSRRMAKIFAAAIAFGFGLQSSFAPGVMSEAFAFGRGGHFGGGHFGGFGGGGHFGGFGGGHFGGGHFGGFGGGHFGGGRSGGGGFASAHLAGQPFCAAC